MAGSGLFVWKKIQKIRGGSQDRESLVLKFRGFDIIINLVK